MPDGPAFGVVEAGSGRLGRKIIFLMILSSAILSVIAAIFQLYISYERDRRHVLNEFVIVEESFKEGLENALWEFNFEQIEVLLNGILAQPDVEYLSLEASTGQSWTRGTLSNDHIVIRQLELDHWGPETAQSRVGTITIGISLEGLRDRIWAQLITLVTSNFVKTLLASMIMLALFNLFVTRHLRAIAQQIGPISWLSADTSIQLDRRPPAQPDDLDHIVATLNRAKDDIRSTYFAREKEVEERRLAQRALRQHSADLEKINAELKNTNREQSEFTYAISHDLKSPSNTIGMLLEELSISGTDGLSPDGQELLAKARKTNMRMTQLIDDLLGYARSIDSETVWERIDLSDLITDILEDLSADIVSTNAQITVGSLPSISGCCMQIRLLFQNLIANAIKFRDPKRTPEIRISSISAKQNGTVRIRVTDNGIGIAPKFHDQIFGLFKRLHTHETYAGTGLGLALCRRIVSNHGGEISLYSQLDQGATFVVELRRAD